MPHLWFTYVFNLHYAKFPLGVDTMTNKDWEGNAIFMRLIIEDLLKTLSGERKFANPFTQRDFTEEERKKLCVTKCRYNKGELSENTPKKKVKP